jgi:hypothetical protein
VAQIWNIRLPNGKVVQPGEWTSACPVYSAVEIGPGSFPALTAFSYGQGGTVPGSIGPRQSTVRDTNLQGEGNRLPENEELVVYVMGIEAYTMGYGNVPLQGDAVDAEPVADEPQVPLFDMLRLQRDLVFRLNIAAVKAYTNAPMGYFPLGSGVAYTISGGRSAASGVAAMGELLGNNGAPVCDGAREFASPLYIGGGDMFAVDVEAGPGAVNNLNLAAGARILLRIFLDGYRRRPVA